MDQSQLTSRTSGPNFFIVGAPRCGTTALANILSQHPDVFIPFVKEPHYFGSDLSFRRGFETLDSYLQLFSESTEKAQGEASTWYLYSKKAAEEIHQFNPDAKIVIVLRNPLEMIYSWHGYAVRTGIEVIEDFSEALSAEHDRKEGKRLPPHSPIEQLIYSEIPLFTEQIDRYKKLFDSSQIHIIVFDDFKTEQLKVVRNLFRFLDVTPDFIPDFDSINSNAHGVPRSKTIARFTYNKPEFLRRLGRQLLPRKLRIWLIDFIRQLNKIPTSREPLEPELKTELSKQYSSEIINLSKLLERDLSHWSDSSQK